MKKNSLESASEPSGFESPMIRARFMRKVFLILTIQLCFTIGFVSIFVFYKPLKMYAYDNRVLFYVTLGTMFFFAIVLSCCESLRRKVPLNFIVLAVLTVGWSILFGCCTAYVEPETILMALGLTTFVVIILCLFATHIRFDFTICGIGLSIGMLLFIVFMIVLYFFPNKTLYFICFCCGAFLVSLYLIFNMQLMMGGKKAYSVEPEEYIFAALNLYLDIIILFLLFIGVIELN